MVRRAASALLLALAWACITRASVLVPTYVLPPESFVRDQRSLGPPTDTNTAESQRTIKRLMGGHIKIKPDKEFGNPTKNSFSFDAKSETGKYVGTVTPDSSGSTVGWNQGIWDDGMLMSSAGEGKEAVKPKEDDEDKKTLSDQVAEGKYGLIQNEIFAKDPKRPGIVSYESNAETRSKDNLQTLGGLKKDEIWLAEDHLLVLKGGSFPERTKESDRKPWPPIDDYDAPKRQVKLPQKPKVPPPFPVRLTDDGPLVFLTPNGSIPAPLFPPFPPGAGESSLSSPPYPFAPGAPYTSGDNQGNSTAGETPLSGPPFPFLPGNASEGTFPFFPPMNGSFPEGFPPGAAYLPPPSNQTDLYDEDDPSIYYPPPYNFSYHAEHNNSVPAGPLVPGIVLPPPPDFFAPLEEKSTTEDVKTAYKPTITPLYVRPKQTTKRPAVRKYKTRPTTTESTVTTEDPSTISTPPQVEIISTPKVIQPLRVVEIPRRPIHVSEEIVTIPKTEKPAYKTRTKLTSKPLSVSVIYDYPNDYPETVYNKPPKTSDKPYVVYSVTQKTPNSIPEDSVTSTPVPLRAYYVQKDHIPTTKLQPVYKKPSSSLASFYFYEEQPKTSPAPSSYFDGRNYYKTISQLPQQQNINSQSGFAPSVDVSYGSLQEDALFLWPQKQGPRTLTQEYFSIQKPRAPIYVQPPKRPETFYQQIADIQQAIDIYTTKRPKAYSNRPHAHKPKAINSRPVYQFSYQNQRPEHFTFRPPKMDPEPFRPMVSYSKPFNLENEFNAITPSVSSGYHQQYLVENVRVSTETPTSTRYYPKTKTINEDYDDNPSKNVRFNQNINHIPIHNDKQVHSLRVPSTTPSPVNHGYYTKQDEKYLDDITKNSFDIFGKKIEDSKHDDNGVAVTPSINNLRTQVNHGIHLQYDVENQSPQPPSLDRDTLVNNRFPRPPINPDSESIPLRQNAPLIQEPRPPSLAGDTLVNDRLPRPTINPDSEFIPIPHPGYRSQHYRVQNQVRKPQFAGEQFDLNEPNLGGDIAVNYKQPLPPINPDAEWITPVNAAGEGKPGSFVSYRLPGDGAHVYFLTPQAAQAQAQAERERYRTQGYGR